MRTRRAGMTALALLVAAATSAQEDALKRLEASPRHQEWAHVKAGARTVDTFVVYPETKAKAHAIIVIHENRGLTDWVRTVADRLAEAGYVALAPDLLSGAGPGGGRTKDFPTADAAREAIGTLSPDQVTADLTAVADYALKLPAVDGTLAVAGFCWGGGQSFRFASNRPDLKAAFVFYGTAPDKDAISRVKAPVYGFYAGNDARVGATLALTAAHMQEYNLRFEPVTYEGAGHGFMRAAEEKDATEANRKAQADAWKRWLELLKAL